MVKKTKEIMESNVVCPNCGTEFTIGKKRVSADERIEAMKNAGLDTSKFFSVTNPSGEEILMAWKDGVPTAVDDDDPIIAAIMAKGTIPNRELFRRWVMSQMFHMMLFNGFTEALKMKGYKYQWKMIANEMAVQAKLYDKGDTDNFNERNIWFNRKLVVAMMNDYRDKLRVYIDSLRVRKCKGVPYKRFGGRDVFVSDLNKKIYATIDLAICKMSNVKKPSDLAKQLKNFVKGMETCLDFYTPQCKGWMDAYKGCGAYYTLKNMVLFHNVFIKWDGHVLKDRDALSRILDYTKACAKKHEGYKVLGLLKEVIKLNNIDVAEKIRSWRKK